jgi:hypothetical protein
MNRGPKGQNGSGGTLSKDVRRRLEQLRHALLRLHKILLEDERAAYERAHGRISPNELLQLLLKDAQFAWLHGISELVVRIDELLESDEPAAASAGPLITQTRALLVPAEDGDEFARKYHSALQRQPDAVLAHRDVTRLLAEDA